MQKVLPVALIWLFILGCSYIPNIGNTPEDSDTRNADKPIITDKSVYAPTIKDNNIKLDIPHTFTNLLDARVFIVNCNTSFTIKLQKKINREWMDAYVPVIPSCLSAPIEIPPQGNYADTLRVSAGFPSGNLEPKFQVDEIEGTYRLVWVDVLSSFDPKSYPFGEQIPLKFRVSNEFKIQ